MKTYRTEPDSLSPLVAPGHSSQGLRTHETNVEPRRPRGRTRGRPRKDASASAPAPNIPMPPKVTASPNTLFQSWEVDDLELSKVREFQEERAKSRNQVISRNLRDAYAKYQQSDAAANSVPIAVKLAAFLQICVPYPRQIVAMSETDQLRLIGLETRGQQQLAMSIFDPTACGKSTFAAHYALMINDAAEPGTLPVIHARLGTSGDVCALYQSILRSVKGGFTEGRRDEESLRKRVLSLFEERGTQLVILDESQHSENNTAFGSPIRSEIKLLLDGGHVPFVLLGTEEAIPILGKDPELAGRMMSPCRLGRLNAADDEDLDLWRGFLRAVEQEMVAKKLVRAAFGLDDLKVSEKLCNVCNGAIGHVMRLIMMALRNSCLRGADQIDEGDLHIATQEWSISLGLAHQNPFGVSDD